MAKIKTIEITNYHKNCMGTISFDMKLPKWRNSQEFIVYPIQKSSDIILIQSDKRWAEINKDTGVMLMTNGKGGHPNSWLLIMQKATNQHEEHTINNVLLSELKMQIFTTAGSQVGDRGVISNNKGAFNII